MRSQGQLASLSDRELAFVDRIATRYAEAVTRYSSVTSQLHLAAVEGDFAAFAAARRALPELVEACRRYKITLEVMRAELAGSPEPVDDSAAEAGALPSLLSDG